MNVSFKIEATKRFRSNWSGVILLHACKISSQQRLNKNLKPDEPEWNFFSFLLLYMDHPHLELFSHRDFNAEDNLWTKINGKVIVNGHGSLVCGYNLCFFSFSFQLKVSWICRKVQWKRLMRNRDKTTRNLKFPPETKNKFSRSIEIQITIRLVNMSMPCTEDSDKDREMVTGSRVKMMALEKRNLIAGIGSKRFHLMTFLMVNNLVRHLRLCWKCRHRNNGFVRKCWTLKWSASD